MSWRDVLRSRRCKEEKKDDECSTEETTIGLASSRSDSNEEGARGNEKKEEREVLERKLFFRVYCFGQKAKWKEASKKELKYKCCLIFKGPGAAGASGAGMGRRLDEQWLPRWGA